MNIRTDFEIPTDREEMKQALGSRLGKSLNRRRVLEEFNFVMEIFHTLIEPKVGWDRFQVDQIVEGQFLLKNGERIGNGPMMDVLKESSELVISLTTIGEKVENEIIKLQENKRLMTAVILDSLGSWVVEQINNQFQFELKIELEEQGYYHNISFAPGDTDWDIRDQQIIFKLLEPEKLGMQLTEVMLMIPQKSLSSLFGISTRPFELNHVKRCEFCARKDTCRIYTAGGI